MSMSIRIVFVTLFGLCVTQTALAESPASGKATAEGDYSYRFSDEDLLGGTLNNMGLLYRGRPGAPRVMLIRPRTSLVQEIIKSAENL
jgi:hypothetical protein